MKKRLGFICLVFSSIWTLGAAQESAKTLEYEYLTKGMVSGAQIVTVTNDRERLVEFSYNDRGRGPNLRTTIRMGPNGIPVYLRTSGVNYQKGDVDEEFTVEGGKARWRSSIDRGEVLYKGGIYSPVNYVPEYTAIIARALLASPNLRAPITPNGVASIEKLETTTFGGNSGQKVTLYAISGFGTLPFYIWLDENNNLFGADYGWTGLIRKGYGDLLDTLKAAQVEASNKLIRSKSATFMHKLDGFVAIKNVRLFDSLSGGVKENATVFMQDGIISAVHSGAVKIDKAAQVIDGGGKMLLPALWDMHAHINVYSYFNYLSAGITNVRDMGNDPDYIIELRQNIRNGDIAAPDVYPVGFIDKKSEFSAPTGLIAETLDEAVGLVDWYAQRGFVGLKIYSSIEPTWVPDLAARAQSQGMKVMGHVPAYMTAEDAIKAGYNEITHINMLFLNFFNDEDVDTRTPQRFTLPILKGGEIDLNSKKVKAFVALMKEREIAHDPTLALMGSIFANKPGEIRLGAKSYADQLPPSLRRNYIARESFNAGIEEQGLRAWETAIKFVQLLHDAGIQILPGTDYSLPGFTLLRELELYVEAGISPSEVLQMATIEPARYLGLDQSLGSITVGKKAHLILVDGDPTVDISDLYSVELVIKGEASYAPDEINQSFGIAPTQ